MDIFKFNERIQRIDAETLKVETFDKLSPEIIALNKSQLQQGKTTKGAKIKPKYKRERYARAKNRQNPLAGKGTPDLFFSGRFYKLFITILQNRLWEVTSLSPLTAQLKFKYKDIMGLNRKNTQTINNKGDRIFTESWLKKTGLI